MHMLAGRASATAHEKFAVLTCRRLPARLNTAEVAVVLGFQEHDIPVLVAARLLTPLGKPAQNAPKYFATVQVLACADDCEWLSTATKAIARHWLRKNNSKCIA